MHLSFFHHFQCAFIVFLNTSTFYFQKIHSRFLIIIECQTWPKATIVRLGGDAFNISTFPIPWIILKVCQPSIFFLSTKLLKVFVDYFLLRHAPFIFLEQYNKIFNKTWIISLKVMKGLHYNCIHQRLPN
jgi:hypothetical protein